MKEELPFGLLIDASEVPLLRRGCKWRAVFQKIPMGKALQLKNSEGNSGRSALARFHLHGDFKELKAITRNQIVYIVHLESVKT